MGRERPFFCSKGAIRSVPSLFIFLHKEAPRSYDLGASIML